MLLGNLLAAGVWIHLSSVRQTRFLMIAGGYTTQHVVLYKILYIYVYILYIYNIYIYIILGIITVHYPLSDFYQEVVLAE